MLINNNILNVDTIVNKFRISSTIFFYYYEEENK